jgi:hypothetical protein
VIEALIDLALEAKDGPTRHFAHMSVARIGARDRSPHQQAAAHEAIRALLAAQLTRPKRSQDRPWAALAAGIYAHESEANGDHLTTPLLAAYEDVKDPAERGAYALALGLAGVQRAAGQIASDLVEHKDTTFRGYAALGLGFLDHSPSLPALRQELLRKGASPAYRRNLALGCRLMGSDGTSGPVVAAYRDAGSWDERRGLSEALGVLREHVVVDPLHDTMQDDDVDAASRASACEALGRVAEATDAPWHADLVGSLNYMVQTTPSLDTILGL